MDDNFPRVQHAIRFAGRSAPGRVIMDAVRSLQPLPDRLRFAALERYVDGKKFYELVQVMDDIDDQAPGMYFRMVPCAVQSSATPYYKALFQPEQAYEEVLVFLHILGTDIDPVTQNYDPQIEQLKEFVREFTEAMHTAIDQMQRALVS